MCLSDDDGRRWSPPQVVVDTPLDDRDPSIVELPNGELLVTFMTYDAKRTAGTHQAFTVRSLDGAHPFGPPERIATPFTQLVAVSTPVRLVRPGRMLLTLYGNNTGDPRSYKHTAVLESKDLGRTWTTLAQIKSPKYMLLEPDLVQLPDNRLLVLMRPTLTWSQSTDGGRTWSEPAEVGIPGDCPYLLLTSRNILLCGIRHRPSKSTAVIFSTDLGKTWKGPVTVDNVVGAYPSMAELPDGRILIAYYTEGRGSDVRCTWLRADAAGVRVVGLEKR